MVTTELVQFRVTFYEVGDIININSLEDEFGGDYIFHGIPYNYYVHDMFNEVPEVVGPNEIRSRTSAFIVNHSFVCLEPVTYMGMSLDWINMKDEVNSSGAEVFADYAVQIMKLAVELGFHNKRDRYNEKAPKSIDVITKWTHDTYRCGSDDVWDTNIELVGGVNLNNLVTYDDL